MCHCHPDHIQGLLHTEDLSQKTKGACNLQVMDSNGYPCSLCRRSAGLCIWSHKFVFSALPFQNISLRLNASSVVCYSVCPMKKKQHFKLNLNETTQARQQMQCKMPATAVQYCCTCSNLTESAYMFSAHRVFVVLHIIIVYGFTPFPPSPLFLSLVL